MVVWNRRPREAAPGHSQKIEAKLWKWDEEKTRMEEVVASIHLRLAVETEEERRARLENDAAIKWLRLTLEMD